MNSERIKTDAIADAVKIPEGATHIDKAGDYWKFEDDKGYFYINGGWCLFLYDYHYYISSGNIVKL